MQNNNGEATYSWKTFIHIVDKKLQDHLREERHIFHSAESFIFPNLKLLAFPSCGLTVDGNSSFIIFLFIQSSEVFVLLIY